MTTRAHRRLSPPVFFDPETELTSSKSPPRQRKVAHGDRTGKRKSQFIDGIVGGERVLIAKPVREGERSVELQARVAIAAIGVLVMKHTVESCPHCGGRPKLTAGLGKGTTDLVCIVPPYGRACFIEMKRPGYSPSDVKDAQHCFGRAVKKYGAVHGIASSVAEALALIELARVPAW